MLRARAGLNCEKSQLRIDVSASNCPINKNRQVLGSIAVFDPQKRWTERLMSAFAFVGIAVVAPVDAGSLCKIGHEAHRVRATARFAASTRPTNATA